MAAISDTTLVPKYPNNLVFYFDTIHQCLWYEQMLAQRAILYDFINQKVNN